MDNCYQRNPLYEENGISVFSKTDDYIVNYEKISTDHLKYFKETGRNPFMEESHWKEIEESTEVIVRKYALSEEYRIMDVGVGMGRLLERFPTMKRYGMDISRGYLSIARQKGIEVCLSLIEDMPYKKNFFDIVICTDVLEHVMDLNLAVSKILDVVKKDGVVIIRVPYKEDLTAYLSPDCPYELVHLRNFDENNLRLLFEKIFKVRVIEFSLAGYTLGPLKFGSHIPLYPTVLRKLLRLAVKLNIKFGNKIAKLICNPVEINIVVGK